MFKDFLSFLKQEEPLPSGQGAGNPLPCDPPLPARHEFNDIEKSYARLFSSPDGRRVLAHLEVMTFQRALGPSCPDAQLRHIEGQRALMAIILRLIDRGKHTGRN